MNFMAHNKVELIPHGGKGNFGEGCDEHGQPRLKKLPKAAQRASVRELEAAIHRRLPERQIIDILVNIAHDTNWIRHFGPLSGSDP
jgi:hypothetical protein